MSSFNIRTGQTKKQNLRFRDEFDTKNEVKPPDNFTLVLNIDTCPHTVPLTSHFHLTFGTHFRQTWIQPVSEL